MYMLIFEKIQGAELDVPKPIFILLLNSYLYIEYWSG